MKRGYFSTNPEQNHFLVVTHALDLCAEKGYVSKTGDTSLTKKGKHTLACMLAEGLLPDINWFGLKVLEVLKETPTNENLNFFVKMAASAFYEKHGYFPFLNYKNGVRYVTTG